MLMQSNLGANSSAENAGRNRGLLSRHAASDSYIVTLSRHARHLHAVLTGAHIHMSQDCISSHSLPETKFAIVCRMWLRILMMRSMQPQMAMSSIPQQTCRTFACRGRPSGACSRIWARTSCERASISPGSPFPSGSSSHAASCSA